jgi:hypothetical protein
VKEPVLHPILVPFVFNLGWVVLARNFHIGVYLLWINFLEDILLN